MTTVRDAANTGAGALREAFDRSFAEAVRRGEVHTDLLAIRVSGDPFSFRVADIRGLWADKKVTALPSSVPALLGIAAFRGSLAPVYDLGVLLGYRAAVTPTHRWLALISPDAPVGVAFDEFDGHVRVAPGDLARADGPDNARPFVQDVARTGAEVRPVIHTSSLLDAIREQSRLVLSTTKER